MRKTPYSICAQLRSMVLLRVIGVGLTGILSVVGAHAQVTVAGFTNSSGFQDLKIGANNVTDIYDTNSNLDLSKQNSLGGNNSVYDLVGDSTYSVVQTATGTVLVSSVATSAMAFRVRIADFAKGPITGGGVILLIQNGSTVFGVGVGVGTTATTITIGGITSNANTTLDKSYQFTSSTISTDAARYSYTQADSSIGYKVTGGSNTPTADAFVTFVVLASELSTISPGFTFGTSTGVSVFTNNGGNGLGSGNINADFISSDGTLTGSLAFGSISGTTTPVPESSTAMILGMVLLPPIGVQLLRRRRRANAASATN